MLSPELRRARSRKVSLRGARARGLLGLPLADEPAGAPPSADAVLRQFRQRSLECHPDKAGVGSVEP